MEIHKFICDCCSKELNFKKITISQNYSERVYNGLDEDWETHSVNKLFHLCPECWESVEKLVIKKQQ